MHCCERVQILSDEHLLKMREHGVVASIQPQFVPSDVPWLSSKLPQHLMSFAFRWKSLLDAGRAAASTGVIILLLEYSLLSISGCKFQVAVFFAVS